MKNPYVRRLRKKERTELLAQASPAPDLKAVLGEWPSIDFWRLPDGRIIEVWKEGGPTDLWEDFEKMKAFYDEAHAFAEECRRRTEEINRKAQAQAEPSRDGAGHSLKAPLRSRRRANSPGVSLGISIVLGNISDDHERIEIV